MTLLRRDRLRCSVMVAMLWCVGFPMPVIASAREATMRVLMNVDTATQELRWVAVNDGVLGGRSRGRPMVEDGTLPFSGELSLANHVGFSDARDRVVDRGQARGSVCPDRRLACRGVAEHARPATFSLTVA